MPARTIWGLGLSFSLLALWLPKEKVLCKVALMLRMAGTNKKQMVEGFQLPPYLIRERCHKENSEDIACLIPFNTKSQTRKGKRTTNPWFCFGHFVDCIE